MKKRYYFLIFIPVLALLAGGCSLPWSKKSPVDNSENNVAIVDSQTETSASGQMKKFSDYQELKSFLDAHAVQSSGYYRGGLVLPSIDLAVAANDAVFNESSSQGAKSLVAGDDYSQTNVQVEGVDEADIIKTDGRYIYAVVYQDLYIIQADPVEETRAVAKISFTSRPSDIYLDGQRLVVIGADNQLMESSVYQNFRRQSPYTFVKIFDLSNPASPKQIRDLDFEGSYRDSRVVGGRLYLIIDNYNTYIPGENVVPRLVDGGKILANDCSSTGRCFAPDVYYFDLPYDSYNFTSINTLDLRADDASVAAQTYILNGAQTIYVSAENLFITYTQYLDEGDLRLAVMQAVLGSKLSSAEQARIEKINQADSDVLSASEKKQKLLQLFQNFLNSQSPAELVSLETEISAALKQEYENQSQNWERTIIYKLALNGGQPVYRATGSVPGAVLNQFSLDEDADGNLRLATTRSRNFSALADGQDSYANVYILSADLQLLGKLENLAPGERIYSVRFLGKRAYLVTFKQTDPLFVIDLSDVRAPKLLGELKVPGFSNYLHPYDDNTLIGLGQDTTLDAYGNVRTGGLKLSLFDVSNPANPRELDSYIAGGAGSASLASSNHKAFLFSRDRNLLAVPASLTSSLDRGRVYFSGALVFAVEQGKFILKAQIDHSDGGKYQRADYWCGSYCYDNSVQRILYIKDALYTFSNKYLKVNRLSDFEALQSVKLMADTAADFEVESLPSENISEVNNLEESPAISSSPLGPSLPSAPAEPTTVSVEEPSGVKPPETATTSLPVDGAEITLEETASSSVKTPESLPEPLIP
ncbi:MAG: beta-propeller domain-containing protein [Patescibacteria group bacterium]|nr:beta-propeller domain-containing protein [Patescibacteria group bacterium]